MLYTHVLIDSIGYVLPEEVVLTKSLEDRIAEIYQLLGIPVGQLEALTKITARRYWPKAPKLSHYASEAAKNALSNSNIDSDDIGMLIYCGVGRDQMEPATACAVANELNLSGDVQLFDISNACLGALNGLLQVANAIELGQIKAGLVVSAESCREIIDSMIEQILEKREMSHFIQSLATLTGGSGAVAIILAHDDFVSDGHRLRGATVKNSSRWHDLCWWGPETGVANNHSMTMRTDSIAVLNHGVELGLETYQDFIKEMDWQTQGPDKFICHQVGDANQKAIGKALKFNESQSFTTYQRLGNIGTVSLPLTAALADKTGFLKRNDKVALLGIGSGLNCLMIGVEW